MSDILAVTLTEKGQEHLDRGVESVEKATCSIGEYVHKLYEYAILEGISEEATYVYWSGILRSYGTEGAKIAKELIKKGLLKEIKDVNDCPAYDDPTPCHAPKCDKDCYGIGEKTRESSEEVK